MIKYNPELVRLYDDFIKGLMSVYPNAVTKDLITAEQFFEMMDMIEVSAEVETDMEDVLFDMDDEPLAEVDGEEVYSVEDLVEALGYEVTEIDDEGAFEAVPRAKAFH